MMKVIFRSVFVEIGSEIDELLKGGVLIFFGENVPSVLKPYCIVHRIEIINPLMVGDVVRIGDNSATITAIGELANKNLLDLHHIVLKNDGLLKASLPGDMSVSGTLPSKVFVGEEMVVFREE